MLSNEPDENVGLWPSRFDFFVTFDGIDYWFNDLPNIDAQEWNFPFSWFCYVNCLKFVCDRKKICGVVLMDEQIKISSRTVGLVDVPDDDACIVQNKDQIGFVVSEP